MRKIKPSDLVGKTIVDVDCDNINCVVLAFDDDTELEIYAELAGKTIVDVDCDNINCVVLTFDDDTELEIYAELASTRTIC